MDDRLVAGRRASVRARRHPQFSAPVLAALCGAVLAAQLAGCSASPAPGPSAPSPTFSRTSWVVPDVDAEDAKLGVQTGVMDKARFTVLKVQRIADEARPAHPEGAIAASIKVCAVATTAIFPQGWSMFVASGQEFSASDSIVYDITPGEDYVGDMRPYFPAGIDVKAGACSTGWLPFDVPDGQRAVLLRYKAVGAAVDWVINVP